MAKMNKVRSRKPSRLRRPTSIPAWNRIPSWLYVAAAVVLVGIVVAVTLSLGQRASSPPSSSASVSKGPVGVAEIGKPAPSFTLRDAYGQTYALNPGDGKNHVLVFFMGNF